MRSSAGLLACRTGILMPVKGTLGLMVEVASERQLFVGAVNPQSEEMEVMLAVKAANVNMHTELRWKCTYREQGSGGRGQRMVGGG